MQYAIIDESGRFADPHSIYITFAAVVADSLVGLDKIISKLKRKLPLKGLRKKERKLAEIKFNQTGDKTKTAVLKALVQKNVTLFLLTINTEGRIIKDTPTNYAFIVSRLLSVVLKENPQLKHIIIDRHFTWIHQKEEFNKHVEKELDISLFIEHLDSQQNTIVTLADFVAGGVREFYTRGVTTWRKLIEKRIKYEKQVSWKELKQQKR